MKKLLPVCFCTRLALECEALTIAANLLISGRLTYVLEAVVADNVLRQVERNAGHSLWALVAVVRVSGAVRVGNRQVVHSDISRLVFGQIGNAVLLNLAKQLNAEKAKEGHEEEKE